MTVFTTTLAATINKLPKRALALPSFSSSAAATCPSRPSATT